MSHLEPSFFREEAQAQINPVRRCDLPAALETAYKMRSGYVHTLRELPRIITAIPSLADVVMIEDKPVLSLHGLARVARHIIHHVVTHAPKVEHENFNYRMDLPNTIQAQMADQYWIWRADKYTPDTARQYLSGFLRQFTSVWSGDLSASVTDIRPVIAKIEELVPGLAKSDQRRPLLTLYFLFHKFNRSEYHQPDWEKFFEKYNKDFDTPSIESMLAHVLTDNIPDWKLEQYDETLRQYFKQRYSKRRIQYGSLFEAAITLFIAEAHRRAEDEQRARELVKEAVENLPKHRQLLDFEATLLFPMQEIDWKKLLLPSNHIDPNTGVVETMEGKNVCVEPAQGD